MTDSHAPGLVTALFPVAALAIAVAAVGACGASPSAPTAITTPSTTTSTTTGSTAATTPSGAFAQFRNGVQVGTSGATVTLTSQGAPDHTSPYWGAGHAMYEAPHAGMMVNPFRIQTMTLTIRVAASPQTAAATSDTPLGPIGMSINGVALYNQYAAGRQPLTSEIVSFDRLNGHPNPSNQYHYHFEPLYITSTNRAALVGVLLDGFLLYGPEDPGGRTPTDLDACNGHTAPTADVPGGVYHYHTTSAVPYIAGCFRGTAGSVG